MQRVRQHVSREEQELYDVEKQMEEQLVYDHMELERVVAIRKEPEGKVGYLCKWKGLPYSEATWESVDIIQEAKASSKVDAYQVSMQHSLATPPQLFLAGNIAMTSLGMSQPRCQSLQRRQVAGTFMEPITQGRRFWRPWQQTQLVLENLTVRWLVVVDPVDTRQPVIWLPDFTNQDAWFSCD